MEKEHAPAPKIHTISDACQVEPHMAAAFCYLLPIIGGIVFAKVCGKEKFVQFHAIQSIIFWFTFWGVFKIAQALTLIYIGYILLPIVTTLGFVAGAYLAWQAYLNINYKIPYLGSLTHEIISNHARH